MKGKGREEAVEKGVDGEDKEDEEEECFAVVVFTAGSTAAGVIN